MRYNDVYWLSWGNFSSRFDMIKYCFYTMITVCTTLLVHYANGLARVILSVGHLGNVSIYVSVILTTRWGIQ